MIYNSSSIKHLFSLDLQELSILRYFGMFQENILWEYFFLVNDIVKKWIGYLNCFFLVLAY
jgi:hypothetical protein